MTPRSPSLRPVTAGDVAALKGVIDASGLFPSELLDDMLAGYLGDDREGGWLTADDGGPMAVAYCAPERMTQETWRLLLVETSGTADFEHVRAYYRAHGYDEEARIRDFYEPGDDRVAFRKALRENP